MSEILDPRAPQRVRHETRLRLASQGLPRGGSVGFELMENARLGLTQFQEQVELGRAAVAHRNGRTIDLVRGVGDDGRRGRSAEGEQVAERASPSLAGRRAAGEPAEEDEKGGAGGREWHRVVSG